MNKLGTIHGDSARKMDNLALFLHALSFVISSTGAYFLIPTIIGDLNFYLHLALSAGVGMLVERIIIGYVKSWCKQLAWWEFKEKGSVILFAVSTFMLVGGLTLDYLISNEGRKSGLDHFMADLEYSSTDSLDNLYEIAKLEIDSTYEAERADIDDRYNILGKNKRDMSTALAAAETRRSRYLKSIQDEHTWARNESNKALIKASEFDAKKIVDADYVLERKETQVLAAKSVRDSSLATAGIVYAADVASMRAADEKAMVKYNAKKKGWSWALFVLVLMTGIGIVGLRLYYELYRRFSGLPMEGHIYNPKDRKHPITEQVEALWDNVWGLASDAIEGEVGKLKKLREVRKAEMASNVRPTRLPTWRQFGTALALVSSVWAVGYLYYRGDNLDMSYKADLISAGYLTTLGVFVVMSALANKVFARFGVGKDLEAAEEVETPVDTTSASSETPAKSLPKIRQIRKKASKDEIEKLKDLCYKSYKRSVSSAKETTRSARKAEFEKAAAKLRKLGCKVEMGEDFIDVESRRSGKTVLLPARKLKISA